jgi:hypothetical protein
MSINDHVVFGLNEHVLIMCWRTRDFWGPINLVAYVTT